MNEAGESLLAHVNICLELADLQSAEDSLVELEGIVRRDFGEKHPNFAVFLQSKARLAREKGNLAEARDLYRSALRILEGANAPVWAIAACNNNLAFASQCLGDYVAAEAAYQTSIDSLRDAKVDHAERLLSQSLSNLANLYHEIGQDTRAEKLQREALAIDEKSLDVTHPDYADHLHNLGVYLAQQDKLREAAELVGRSTTITEQSYGPRHPRFAAILAQQASFNAEFRRYNEAEVKAVFALETVRRIYGERHPEFADMLRLLGSIYSSRGKFDQAEGALERAAEIERDVLSRDHPQAAETSRHLVIALAAQGKTRKAFQTLVSYQRAQAALSESVLRLCSDAERLKYVSDLQSGLEMAVGFVAQFYAADTAAVQWAYDLALRRKGLAAEAFAARRDSILGKDDAQLRAQLDRLNQLRVLIGRALLDRSYDVTINEKERQLAGYETEKAELEHTLSRRIPEIGLSTRLRNVDTKAVAKALPARSILVEYVRFSNCRFNAVEAKGQQRWGSPRYAVFTLLAGLPDSLRFTDLGEADSIDHSVAEYNQWLRGNDGSRRSAGSKRGFRDLAADAPLASGKRRSAEGRRRGSVVKSAVLPDSFPDKSETNTLIIAPEGALASLSFESLPDNDGVLLDRFSVSVSYLNSGRDALRFEVPTSREGANPIVVADPDFDLCATNRTASHYASQSRELRTAVPHFKRLEGTRIEGNAVAKELGVTPKLNAEAVERTVKQCQSPQVLHLATHGFFFETTGIESNAGAVGRIRFVENPMLRSGLALAGANAFLDGRTLPEEAEDGILTAEDVSGLDLRATRLVVLSACETGLGEIRSGEGVFGLRRAFALAGARTLVVSLWKVSDPETAELMTQFYRELGTSQQPAAALRKAQIVLRSKHSDPYYWAAFICIGDP